MHVIVLRTYAHDTITEMAANAKVPVINALSDLEHPCQAIADFMTLEERFGSLEGLKFTYVGDGNNVCHSLMLTAALLGVHCTVATPKGFEPKLEIVHKAIEIAENTGGSLTLTHDPLKAAIEADAIYTDVCTSMGQEHEAARRAPIFKPFQVNDDMMSRAQESAVFMHCLPAHRGAEVTDAVLDGPQSVVFDQAENRMHAQKAITLMLLGGAKRIPSNRNRAGLQARPSDNALGRYLYVRNSRNSTDRPKGWHCFLWRPRYQRRTSLDEAERRCAFCIYSQPRSAR